MADPAAPEDVAARDGVAGGLRAIGQHAQNLRPQLGADLLVGVDRQDPVVPGLGGGEVLLGGEAGPGPDDDPVGELAGDLHRAIRRLGVHDHDLVRPGQAGQAGREPPSSLRVMTTAEQGARARPRGQSSSAATAARTGSTASRRHGAVGPPHHAMAGAIGTRARRVRRSVESHAGHAEGGGQVQRSGVRGHQDAGPAQQGEEGRQVGGGASSAPDSRAMAWASPAPPAPTARGRRRRCPCAAGGPAPRSARGTSASPGRPAPGFSDDHRMAGRAAGPRGPASISASARCHRATKRLPPRRHAQGAEQGQLLLDDVPGGGGRLDAAVGEEGVERLPAAPGGEPDAQGGAGGRGEHPALEVALEVDGHVEAAAAELAEQGPDRARGVGPRPRPGQPAPSSRVRDGHLVDRRVAPQERGLAALHHPGQVAARESRRRAAATGRACTTSPSEESLTMATFTGRRSRPIRSPPRPKRSTMRAIRSRVACSLGSPAMATAAPSAARGRGLGDGVGRVVGALGVDGGPHGGEQPIGGVAVEHHHVIDGAQAGEQLGALARRASGAARRPSAAPPPRRS